MLLALSGVLPLAVWLLSDAGLGGTLSTIRLMFDPNFPFADSLPELFWKDWDTWTRIGILAVVFGWWAVCLSLALWRDRSFVHGDSPQDHLRRRDRTLMTVVRHIVVPGLLLTQSHQLMAWGLHFRIALIAEPLTQLAVPLFQSWPGKPVQVAGLGLVGPHPQKPDHLFVMDGRSSDSFTEGVGLTIDRSPTGNTVVLDLGSSGMFRSNLVAVHRTPALRTDDLWLQSQYPNWRRKVSMTERLDLIPGY